MVSSKYDIDFQLSPIENQEYIFSYGFFTQEFLLYEQGNARQVFTYILYIIYILIILRNVFNVRDVDIIKKRKSKQNSTAIIFIIIINIILQFQLKKRLKKGLNYKIFIYNLFI